MYSASRFSASVLLIGLAMTSLMVGVADLSVTDFLSWHSEARTIFLDSRLPRLLAICLAGCGLSISGLIMQQIVQNRFAAPSTTGTIDCALLGYVLSLIWFSEFSGWVHLCVIMTFAVVGTLIFTRFLQHLKFKNTMLVPLIGIMYGNVISSAATFIAYRYDLIQTFNSWRIANFASVLRGNYELLYLAIPAFVIAYFYAAEFNAASIGESFARNIGLDFQKIVLIGVILVAIVSSAVIMIVGVIPFLGLVVPNLVSMLMGDNLKRNLPWTAYWGVILVLICDIAGRLIIFPFEIPISMIVSILGGIVFISLIIRDKSHA